MRGKSGLALLVVCGLTIGAFAQSSSPYRAPHIPTWREFQQKLGSDYHPSAAPERHDPQCELPEAPPDSLMVQVSAREGSALSTVTIGSQDVETSAAQVKVAPGGRPLYLVISSAGPVIWRFSGAVDRVQRLILSSETGVPGRDYDPMPLVGEIGVPEERVFTVRRRGCLRAFDGRDANEAALAAEFVHHQVRAAGRDPDRRAAGIGFFHSRRLGGDAGRSGVTAPYPGAGKAGRSVAIRTGVSLAGWRVPIRADRVVASRHVEAYAVLPGAAGLQQLIRAGTLTQISSEEFAVRRGFRFPAGITQGVNATFLLGTQFGSNSSCRFERDNVRNAEAGVICD